LSNLREIVILDGSSNLVYLDESGFEEYVYRPYGWSTAWFYMVGKPDRSPSSKRGQKTYGDKPTAWLRYAMVKKELEPV
jgi:hypothetical protein